MMPRLLIVLGIIFIVISFITFLMGLLRFIPIAIGAVLLFVSILITVSMFNSRNQFRGFNN
ncbi:MAG: hypothetical protein WBV93_06010 [Anaerobacillus sp.]